MERKLVVLDREAIESNLCFKTIFCLLCEEWTGGVGVEIAHEIRSRENRLRRAAVN